MIDTHYDSTDLALQLGVRRTVAGRKRPRGNSAPPRPATLDRLYALMPLAGISRIANISWLSPSGMMVCQASRPDIYSHPFFGQNTGSQGKGFDAKAAQVGAIMEAIESYCAEPRGAWLLRGSYEFLRNTQAILPPSRFCPEAGAAAARDDEPLMWTPALSLERRKDVLIPAQAAFFPFYPAQYQTRSIFPSNSTGLGAGSDLQEAALHGLYEVMERHFRAELEKPRPCLRIERFQNDSLRDFPWFSRLLEQHAELEPCVLSVRWSNGPRDPAMVVCILVDEKANYYPGFGCHLQPLTALEKAITEALQSAVTVWAGSREDHAVRRLTTRQVSHVPACPADLPPQSLPLERYARSQRKRDSGVRGQLDMLLRTVHALGFPDVILKNLTRVGLGVPVVRAIVPGMQHPAGWLDETHEPTTEAGVMMCRFALDL